jgi:aryl-alcohol dehydrogenase-like predicted oxidoreductase
VTTLEYTHTTLPHVGKRVLRLGIAANYGMAPADVAHAAERGANLWVWTKGMGKAAPALRAVLQQDRDRHAVAWLTMAWTAAGVRRAAERARRELGVDRLDLFLLSWLGTGSAFTQGVQDALLALKAEGKAAVVGTSIHDRPRAGRLAEDSILEAFMLRYNAAHPGAEEDIFPHLATRNPAIIAYTATSWRQLLKPLNGVQMPPWPGEGSAPPLSAGLCYRFCLQSPHVHAVLTGPADRRQLDENLDAIEKGPLSEEEYAWIRAYGRLVKGRKRIPFL